MWKDVYQSPWHNPGFFWLVTAVFLVLFVRKRSFLVGYLTLFAVETIGDALALGELSPLSRLGPDMASYVTIAIVILGDFRFFLLVERYARAPVEGPTPPATWLVAAALAFVVPVTVQILRVALPDVYAVPRHVFLTYESLFVVLAAVMRFVVLPRRLAGATDAIRTWLLSVSTYVLVYYVLWALADVVILRGFDAGFALRLIPNSLYYAFFLPFVWWKAPAEALA
jgi:hypothetical protein